MPWIEMPGIEGRVYVPDDEARPKKHPCVDCFDCQWCSDARCESCRKKATCGRRKRQKSGG